MQKIRVGGSRAIDAIGTPGCTSGESLSRRTDSSRSRFLLDGIGATSTVTDTALQRRRDLLSRETSLNVLSRRRRALGVFAESFVANGEQAQLLRSFRMHHPQNDKTELVGYITIVVVSTAGGRYIHEIPPLRRGFGGRKLTLHAARFRRRSYPADGSERVAEMFRSVQRIYAIEGANAGGISLESGEQAKVRVAH